MHRRKLLQDAAGSSFHSVATPMIGKLLASMGAVTETAVSIALLSTEQANGIQQANGATREMMQELATPPLLTRALNPCCLR